MASGSDQPQIPRGLIGRKGTPSGKGARLPSIRGPRDLTLGGIQKKVFTPNIPARRNKAVESDDPAAASKPDDNKSRRPQSGPFRGRGGRDGGDRGRGRGNGRGRGSNIIQTHSLFEQGPSEKLYRPSSGSEYVSSGVKSGSSSSGSRVTIKKETTDTKEVLDYLLRDDFIAGQGEDDSDVTLQPVVLPLAIKSEVKAEQPDYTKVKVKSEAMETEDTVKPKIATAPDINNILSNTTQDKVTCSELFTNQTKSEMGQMLFFQLPDTLPGLPASTDDDFRSKKSTDKQENTQSGDLSTKMDSCNLDNFTEGLIGKLVVRKSGKVQLMLGTAYLDVNLGTPCSFLQDVASVRVTGDHGDISILGHVEHRLVCTPDFEALLDNT